MTGQGPKGFAAEIATPCVNDIFLDPFFCAAAEEIEALGLHIAGEPHAGAEPYCVVNGHSGSRSWLIPLKPHAVNVSSLALIQPMRSGARVLKQVAVSAAKFGLPWYGLYGIEQRLHISGDNYLIRTLGPEFAHCAFFSGTASPHRKVVVQIMDREGRIHGYAKVSRTPAVHPLLENEALIMQEVRSKNLPSALIPDVLLHEVRDGTAILATDTTKRSSTRCIRRLTRLHLSFLQELAERSSFDFPARGASLSQEGIASLGVLERWLSAEWRERIERALDFLSSREELIASTGLSHGDFTPWNVFSYQNRLCVIDWEYAGRHYPADYDLIHFLFSLSNLDGSPPEARCDRIYRTLVNTLGRSGHQAHARLTAYLCARMFFLAGRQHRCSGVMLHWEGERELALMLDALAIKSPTIRSSAA